jgi:hypothetical protein
MTIDSMLGRSCVTVVPAHHYGYGVDDDAGWLVD